MNLTDPKHPASRPDPKVQYIWDLACDQQGNLLAATGPNGQLWKRVDATGNGRSLYDSKSTHLLCLAVGPDGSIYAGSDGEGLIYRVTRDGKATIIFDAPQSEIRTLLWGGDGALYAGTAAEAGGGNSAGARCSLPRGRSAAASGRTALGPGRIVSDRRRERRPGQESGAVAARPAPRAAEDAPGRPAGRRLGVAAADHGGRQRRLSARRRRSAARGAPVQSAGARAGLGRRSPDRRAPARKGSSSRSASTATRPRRSPSSIPDRSSRSWPSRTARCCWEPATRARSSGFPRATPRREPWSPRSTTPSSSAGSAALSWRAERPRGHRRSHSSRARATWASPTRPGRPGRPSRPTPPRRRRPVRPGDSSSIASSSRTTRPATYAGAAIGVAQLPDGQPGAGDHAARHPRPERADGAAKQTRLNIRWDATDPNEDDLNYTLQVRKEGWPEWIRLDSEPLTEKTFAWDTTAFPSGVVSLEADGERSAVQQRGRRAHAGAREPDFLVDHDPPVVTVTPKGAGASIVAQG